MNALHLLVIRLRERASWLESRSFAELHGDIERQAANAIEELAKRYDVALDALKRCYDAGHRNGWEDGETNAEVFAAVNDILSGEKLE